MKELALKAGFEGDKWGVYHYTRGIEGNAIDNELSKFAELIVDECLSLCEDERDLQQIKEYFGVK
jgi:hypothetical protein